jgi:hypothetical protein
MFDSFVSIFDMLFLNGTLFLKFFKKKKLKNISEKFQFELILLILLYFQIINSIKH